jgi:anti-anti-sigma factor
MNLDLDSRLQVGYTIRKHDMSVTSEYDDATHTLTITVDGRFDFNCHQVFRQSYEARDAESTRFVVDLQNTAYIDSSALGMLLLLRDYAGGDQANILLRHCNGEVRNILAISNFEKLFDIK